MQILDAAKCTTKQSRHVIHQTRKTTFSNAEKRVKNTIRSGVSMMNVWGVWECGQKYFFKWNWFLEEKLMSLRKENRNFLKVETYYSGISI